MIKGSRKCHICHKMQTITVQLMYPRERVTRTVCQKCYPKEWNRILKGKEEGK